VNHTKTAGIAADRQVSGSAGEWGDYRSGMDDDAQQAALERLSGSPLFPFNRELQLKSLGDLLPHEIIREGEGDRPYMSCGNDERIWWSNERWKITALQPTANPVGLFLETVDHIDFEDFDEQLAAEYGVLTMHIEAAVRSLDSVGRVHIHRWGDGSAHFHVWFQGRPARQLELYGWGNVLWAQVLPPLSVEQTNANHRRVVERVHETAGGTLAT